MSEARAVAPHSAYDSDRSNVAVLSLSAGVAIFSLQDVAVKWLSDGYAVTEIVFIRSLVGAPLLLLMVLLGRTPPTLRTRRPLLHFVRAALMFISYVSFYMALTALPLAEAVAIGFSSPLVITIFSVIFLTIALACSGVCRFCWCIVDHKARWRYV